MRRGKRYLTVRERIDRERVYPLDDALNLVVETATARFDETAEAAFRLGVNPSQHMIRGGGQPTPRDRTPSRRPGVCQGGENSGGRGGGG